MATRYTELTSAEALFSFTCYPGAHGHAAMTRITVKTSLFYSMLALGFLTLITGFILYLWPHGQRAGRLIFLGISKTIWAEWHTYISLVAIALIIVHLLENRKGVDLYVRTTLGKA